VQYLPYPGREAREHRGAAHLGTRHVRMAPVEAAVEEVFRREAGRALATLIRLPGDFDFAEEARQDAFAAALEQWPHHGFPSNPSAWLIRTGRNKAIDRIRRDMVFREKIVDRETASAEADDRLASNRLVDSLTARGEFSDYHLLARLGRNSEARDAYRAALAGAKLDPERRLLSAHIEELGEAPDSEDRVDSALVAPVAQLDRALRFERSGRRFESVRARHEIKAGASAAPARTVAATAIKGRVAHSP
jgi:predicted RNA polymerase sigma factor